MTTREQIKAFLDAGREELELGSVFADQNRLLGELFNELEAMTCEDLQGLLLQIQLSRLMGED